MKLERKISVVGVVMLLLMTSVAMGSTTLDWEVLDTLQLDATPLDVAISPDGKTVFVLTQSGSIHIYQDNGRLTDKLEVGEPIDQIQLSPDGEQLFATSRQSKTVKVIALDFIKQIETKGSPYKGPDNAPVVIADFSDFEWSYCARLAPLLEQVLEKNPKTVKIVFKNFPIRSHKFAVQAAVAALAADRQGKFWDFHDELFNNYNRLNEEKVQEIAAKLKLNMAQFEKDRKDPLLMEQVRQDVNEGIQADVKGVPSVFINGRKLRDRSLAGFQTLIDKALEDLKQK